MVQSTDDDDDEEEEEEEDIYEEDESTAQIVQSNNYPTLPMIRNGFENFTPLKTSYYKSTVRRIKAHTSSYESMSYQPLFEQQNYEVAPFKAPLPKPTVSNSTSGLDRRMTTSSFNWILNIHAPYLNEFTKRLSQLRPEPLNSTSLLNRLHPTNSKQKPDDDSNATEHSDIDAPYLSDFTKRLSQLRPEPLNSTSLLNRLHPTNSKQKPDDDSDATEHSDIDAPYLSDFTKRVSQLRPEPLDRKIIADVKQRHLANDSMWQSFSNLIVAFWSRFDTIILAGNLLVIVVLYIFLSFTYFARIL